MRELAVNGYGLCVLLYLAVAASLITLTIVIRIVRFALVVLAVALTVVVASGHGPLAVGHLFQLW